LRYIRALVHGVSNGVRWLFASERSVTSSPPARLPDDRRGGGS
jgi:hypothetical protein